VIAADTRDAWPQTSADRRYADQPNSVTTAVQAARKPNPFNALRRFWSSAGFALCCEPCRVGRDMLVGLLL